MFKLIGDVTARTDAMEGSFHIDVQNEQDIGKRREFLVFPANVERVDTPRALVCHGGEVVAVEYDDLALGQGGEDESIDVFASVLEEVVEFIRRRQAPGLSGFSYFFPPWAVCGFAA